MKNVKSEFLKGLALSGLLGLGVTGFAATEGGIDIGAVQTTEIGWVQVSAPSAVSESYTFPARAANENFSDAKWAIAVKPELGVSAANFHWVKGTASNSVTPANIDWQADDASLKAKDQFDADLPAGVNLTDVAASPVFVTNGTWNTFSGKVSLTGSQTFAISPVVGADASTEDAALSAAILAESTNYTYSEVSAQSGFSVSNTGLVTVASGAYGIYRVNVNLAASGDKWNAIADPATVTVTVDPIRITAMTLTAPADLVYSGQVKVPTVSGITVDSAGLPDPVISFTYSANTQGIDALDRITTATAVAPQGYVITAPNSTIEYQIEKYPITAWSATPTIADFTFGDAVPPAITGFYEAQGVPGEMLKGQPVPQPQNYNRWDTTVMKAEMVNEPEVVGGRGNCYNYDYTKVPNPWVKKNANPMTVSYESKVVSVAAGETKSFEITPVVTGADGSTDCLKFIDDLKAAVSNLTAATPDKYTLSGLDVTGTHLVANDAVTAAFTPIANKAALAGGATSVQVASVTVTPGECLLTGYKLKLDGDETNTVAYKGTAVAMDYTQGTNPLPAGTTWKVMKDGVETAPLHAGSYTYVPSNDDYTFTPSGFDNAFTIAPIAVQLKFASAPANVMYGQDIVKVKMASDNTPASGDTFEFADAATTYTPWTTEVGTENVTFSSVDPTVTGVALEGDYTFTAAADVKVSVTKATFVLNTIQPVSLNLNGTHTFTPSINWTGFAEGARPAVSFAVTASSDESKVTFADLTVTGKAVGSSDITLNATGASSTNYEVTPVIVTVTVQDKPFSTTVIWLSKTGTDDGSAFDKPASVSRFVAAAAHADVTEIRIIGDATTPVVVGFDTVTMPAQALKISSNWTGLSETGTDNALAAVLTGSVTLADATTLENVIIDASATGKTITFAGTLKNVTAKVESATALAGTLTNCVVFGNTITTGGTLKRTAYQIDGIGGDVEAVTGNMTLSAAASDIFGAKIGADWKPMSKTTAPDNKASILINRGSISE